jgi:hypothetical protein
MNHIMEFNSWEEAQERMKEMEDKANASVSPKQQEIVYGSYWLRAVEGTGWFEYGHVLEQSLAESKQTKESVRALRDAYARGYRFSKAHSLYSVRGELGDSHIAVLWPITEEEFIAASAAGFAVTQAQWEQDMLLRIQYEIRDWEALVALRNIERALSSGHPQEEDHA